MMCSFHPLFLCESNLWSWKLKIHFRVEFYFTLQEEFGIQNQLLSYNLLQIQVYWTGRPIHYLIYKGKQLFLWLKSIYSSLNNNQCD